jgi:hypothetical protein
VRGLDKVFHRIPPFAFAPEGHPGKATAKALRALRFARKSSRVEVKDFFTAEDTESTERFAGRMQGDSEIWSTCV